MAGTSNRGFASMDAERQREIASKGGKAAHKLGTAHQFTPDEARVAGRKGGEMVSQNRQHMSNIGRLGGEASRLARQQNRSAKIENPEQGQENRQPEQGLQTGEGQRGEGFQGSL